MFRQPSEKYLYYLFLPAYFILQLVLIFVSESAYGYGGADNIAHYQISRYSFKYPELFLDLWGKPVYTLLSAPFAQVGYEGAKIFNVVVAVFTFVLTAKIVRQLFPWELSPLIAVVFIAFSPVYFLLATSCLTEILFSFILIAAVYLFIRKRFIFAAIAISFLPLVRSEGFVLFPVIGVALLLSRSYRSLPFLFAGTVIYSFIGYLVFDDWLWLINKQPYTLEQSIYGSGSLHHFIKHSHSIFGIPLLVLIVFGLVVWFIRVIRRNSWRHPDTILFLLITGSWVAFFAAHSYVWWKGTGGSAGLTRVIGSVIPLAAITGLQFYALLMKKVRRTAIVNSLFGVLAILQVVLFFTRNNLDLQPEITERLMKETAEYIRKHENGKKVFYTNPLLVHLLGLDPFDFSQCYGWITDRQQPSNSLEWGDLLVWDAHFGPNEGRVPFENLEADPYLVKLKALYPLETRVVIGGYHYSVQVYKKVKDKEAESNVIDSLGRKLSFENSTGERVLQVDGFSVCVFDERYEFGPYISIKPDEVQRNEVIEISASLHYKALDRFMPDQVLLVFSVDHAGKNLHYRKIDLLANEGEWKHQRLFAGIPASIPESAEIGVYIWNKNKKKLLMENLSVEIKSY